MQILIPFFLLLGFVQSKLEFVVTIHRHGARTPNKLYKPGYWPEGKAQLTELGRKQMLNLGKEYRSRYISNEEGFFPSELSSSTVRDYFVLSSSKDRAYESFYYLYQGIFNNSSSVELVRVNITDGFKYSEADEKNRTNLYVFLTPDQDYFLHAFDQYVCPKAGKIQKKISQGMKYLQKLEHYRKNLFPLIFQELNKKWGTNFYAENMTFSEMSSILDLMTSAKAHNITRDIPEFSEYIMTELRKAKQFYVFEAKFGDEFLSRITVTKIFRVLSKMLVDRFEGSRPNPKWLEISGHDTFIAGFLKALLTAQELGSADSKILEIPYASHFEIEIHSTTGGQRKVKFFYNWQEIKLGKCGNPCSLKRFIGLLVDLSIKGDIALLCKNETEQKIM